MAKNRKVSDTTSRPEMEKIVVESLLTGTSGAIEAQESRGQAELIASEQIPVRLRGFSEDDLMSLGFVLGDRSGDGLFREAKLPPGWTRRPTSHSLWSEIVDKDGVVKFHIFYKAAFYDRDAFMNRA